MGVPRYTVLKEQAIRSKNRGAAKSEKQGVTLFRSKKNSWQWVVKVPRTIGVPWRRERLPQNTFRKKL